LTASHLAKAARPLIVVLGPTGSGKTAFSVRLAKWIRENGAAHGWQGGEIVNADSRQLYRHLDVGTAKVTNQEKDGVPHHLFDVLDPSQEVTISWYQERATAVIDEILSRKQVPLLVGGSMLYISALIDGLEPLPPVEKVLRERLEAAYDEDKGQSLYEKLQRVDPETAAAFHPNNRPYLVRAMALYETTGIAPSLQKKKFECPYDLLMFGMYWERKAITKRIEARTPKILEGGWIQEVLDLRAAGHGASSPAFKSHGYREVLAMVEAYEAAGKDPHTAAKDPALIHAIDLKTRQYAKRQMTWWKHDERIQWIAG
jgi:tRNA dimethylallyltransferase